MPEPGTADQSSPTRVLLDTNVLIAAIDSSRPGHLRARQLVEDDPRALAIGTQNMREFLVALTRPREANGFGVSGARAVADWQAVSATLEFVEERAHTPRTLASLVTAGLATGKQIHDAALVALALTNGAASIVTANRRHFARFSELITVEDLV